MKHRQVECLTELEYRYKFVENLQAIYVNPLHELSCQKFITLHLPNAVLFFIIIFIFVCQTRQMCRCMYVRDIETIFRRNQVWTWKRMDGKAREWEIEKARCNV